jgi:hypothetical protein
VTAVPPTAPDADVAAALLGVPHCCRAVLVLLLFVAGGAGRDDGGSIGRAASCRAASANTPRSRAGLAVAVERCRRAPWRWRWPPPPRPRVVPRCRQVQCRGLPPPRAPTA